MCNILWERKTTFNADHKPKQERYKIHEQIISSKIFMVCYHQGLSSIKAGTCAMTSVDIERHGGPKCSPDISDEGFSLHNFSPI